MEMKFFNFNLNKENHWFSDLCGENTEILIRQHQNAKLIFEQNLEKNTKSEHQHKYLHIQISLLLRA